MRWLTLLLLASCGGKLDAGDGGLEPDAYVVDASLDGIRPPIVADAGPPIGDASLNCSPAMYQVGIGGGGNDCKLGIDWTCGTTHYGIGGVCTNGKGYTGSCFVNGMPVNEIIYGILRREVVS